MDKMGKYQKYGKKEIQDVATTIQKFINPNEGINVSNLSKPSISQPTISKPTVLKPVVTKSTVVRPIVSKPTVSKPTVTAPKIEKKGGKY